jgi:hypothetical protein
VASVFTTAEGAVIGGGIAIATAAGIEPIIEPGRQTVWTHNPYAVLDPGTLARLVAQGLTGFDPAQAQAQRNGLDANKFRALVEMLKTAPGAADLDQMLNRELIDREQFNHALAKHQIEPQFWDAYFDLLNDRLSPPVIALAIVRGIISDPGFLPVGPPAAVGKVPKFPTSTLNALKEAQAAGWDRERLFVQTAISGRPMGPEAAAAAVFRDILERVDFDRAIAEGDIRNEWASAIFETSRQIPSVADYVQLHLRGHIDAPGMHAGAARHGMSAADADRIYLRSGRPAAPGQMATAAVRGIDGPLGRPMDREQFLLGIAESDIRPEWGPMLWESRFLYPSLFQLTRLVTSGAIPVATGAEWARKARYAPEVVTALTESWGGAQAPTRDPHVVKAENQLWTTLHTSYKNGEADAADAEAGLDLLGVPQGNHARILNLWNHERALVRKQLTPTQLKKAWKGSTVNPATGAPWTRDEAIARLERMGYSAFDAETFLDE